MTVSRFATGGGLGPPGREDIEEAALLLGLAARPVILAGGGVIRAGASSELQEVAEFLGAPVVTTFSGKGAIDESHPLAIGTMVGQPETAAMLAKADAMLAVGTRFSARATGNGKLDLPAQLIHLDIDQDEIGRNYPVRLGIAADARLGLESLLQALKGRREPKAPWWS